MISLKFSVLIVGGGRWAEVYIKELLRLPFAIDLSVISRSNVDYLKDKYKNLVSAFYSSFDNLCHAYNCDLGIIATIPDCHLHDFECISKYCKNILMEKPVADDSISYSRIYDLAMSYQSSSSNLYISCPALYSHNINNLFTKAYQLSYIECSWQEKIPHPSNYRLDKDIRLTAISHYLPLLLYNLGFRYSDCSEFISTSNHLQCTFQGSNNRLPIKIQYNRSVDIQDASRTIVLESSSTRMTINLNSPQVKKKGCIVCGVHTLSPMQAQVFDILSKHTNRLYYLIFLNQYELKNIFSPRI